MYNYFRKYFRTKVVVLSYEDTKIDTSFRPMHVFRITLCSYVQYVYNNIE